MVEKETNTFVSSKAQNMTNEVKDELNLYFCKRMTEHHNNEENKLKYITYNHVYAINENHQVNLNVYYGSCKKNTHKTFSPKANDHCVYRYTCDDGQCSLSYIRYTQCKLKQRFSGHAQNGSIKNHILENHPTQRVKSLECFNFIQV